MDIAPIKTQHDYRYALKEIEGLMTAKRATGCTRFSNAGVRSAPCPV
jgi:antitoxin component HigA of HigAB toxin-antitoxin module